jgi:hypothetical protein
MAQFEGTYVPYMLNQAKMCFAIIRNYPHYKVEGDKLVVDTGPESQELRQVADDCYDLIKRIDGKIKAGMRIPRTWVRRLQAQETLVLVMREQRAVTADWAEEFQRTLRFLGATVN